MRTRDVHVAEACQCAVENNEMEMIKGEVLSKRAYGIRATCLIPRVCLV
jgi:hypothetical protein